LSKSLHNSPRGGFSIIELMVSVAIIAIVAAVVLPGLSNAKERGHRALCQNRLRQFHLVALLYAGDHDDLFPPAIKDTMEEHLAWIGSTTWTNLKAYGSGSDVFMDCPNYPPPLNKPGGFYNPGYGYLIGYHYFAGFHSWGDWDSPQKVTDNPELLLLTDVNQWGPGLKMARYAHGPTGARLFGAPFNDNNISVTPNEAGVSGGHRAYLNGSIQWVPRPKMKEHVASFWGTAYMGAW
jgi:prepilin-type N-terminal cleavage/methylation domain-containing protein